jgi:hypothetical protein
MCSTEKAYSAPFVPYFNHFWNEWFWEVGAKRYICKKRLNMKNTVLPENMVELEEAMSRIDRWRRGSGADALTKAFYISRADIEALYNELNLLGQDYIGVRAYIGTREEKGNNNVILNVDELLMVAVIKNPDHHEDPNGVDLYAVGDEQDTRIYDLTSPCPRMCDSVSPLFTLIPPDGKKPKKNLSDFTKK